MTEFTIRNNTYDIGKINAFDQLFISRKVTPFILSWQTSGKSFDEAFAEVPEEDIDAILKKALPSIKRQAGKDFFPIWNSKAGTFMYDDIEGQDLMNIFFAIIGHVVTPFFREHTQQASITQ